MRKREETAGVKKGTYYIKVSADGLFRFRYRFTKVK